MISTANDPGLPRDAGDESAMTVLELSIFVCAFRARTPIRASEIFAVMHGWFGDMPADQVALLVPGMVSRGWLTPVGEAVKASEQGRRAARPLVEGIIRMLDQGTRLIDVALMMSVLRLTRGELDNGPADN
ncbi:hypothetical protein SAMIE_2000620 (plasmid) [Sphingobium amiense]|jgi:hypothetical protein|uniref:MarR family transcriptional regulator n=3 Tax=Sphingomonadaceae TaxID=41297 RepID=A0A494WGP5_9SPHN|nr:MULTISPECIES: hypothetical protein [Sphingobium]BBE00176.1 hypothetical protein SAMIE_2000620 [Sphingobium amiense]